MKYAIIKDGVVVNVAEAEPDFAAAQGWVPLPEKTDDGVTTAGRGCLYQNGKFLPEPRNIAAEWVVVRAHRDLLLVESDVMVLPDRWATFTPEVQAAWTAYRQALRDIPQTFADPKDVVWPTSPPMPGAV